MFCFGFVLLKLLAWEVVAAKREKTLVHLRRLSVLSGSYAGRGPQGRKALICLLRFAKMKAPEATGVYLCKCNVVCCACGQTQCLVNVGMSFAGYVIWHSVWATWGSSPMSLKFVQAQIKHYLIICVKCHFKWHGNPNMCNDRSLKK